jgi:hypothetical protein
MRSMRGMKRGDMSKLKAKAPPKPRGGKKEKIDLTVLRRSRIEQLKTMINNEEYLTEAVVKLAKSLTSGLMK